ncbi:MAG: hypothetical protein AAFR79_16350 [Pseudomonadota bacterium]
MLNGVPWLFRPLVQAALLILGGWGPDRITARHRRGLLEIVEDRDQAGGLLITGQLPVGAWHAIIVFDDPRSRRDAPPSPMPSWIA